jgi:hypothetical protein
MNRKIYAIEERGCGIYLNLNQQFATAKYAAS